MPDIVKDAERPTASERLLAKPEAQNDQRAGSDGMTPALGEDPIDPFKQPIHDPSRRDPDGEDGPEPDPFEPAPGDPFAMPGGDSGDGDLIEIPIPS